MFEFLLVRPQKDARGYLRSHNGDIGCRAENSFDLLLGDQTPADDQDPMAFEFEKNRVQRHGNLSTFQSVRNPSRRRVAQDRRQFLAGQKST